MNQKSDKKQVVLYMSSSIVRDLDIATSATGYSRSNIVEDLIKNYLADLINLNIIDSMSDSIFNLTCKSNSKNKVTMTKPKNTNDLNKIDDNITSKENNEDISNFISNIDNGEENINNTNNEIKKVKASTILKNITED